MVTVTQYGAGTDKSPRENQAAIQRAIDESFAAGGGTVVVPAGRFRTGNLELKSNVTLYLENGVVLEGSRDWRDYRFSGTPFPWVRMAGIPDAGNDAKLSGFLWAEDAENVGVEGPGIVDGQGGNHTFPAADDPYLRRPMLILFLNCRNVRVTDVTMREPAFFNFYAVFCRRVWIRGVFVDSLRTENGDGLDFDGTEEVTISDCILEAGDDAISLKCTMPSRPCRVYAITNCRLSSIWAGFRMGTESTADMKDIVISNCIFDRCNDGLKIQDCSTGVYENVRVSNCVMRDVHRPVFMTVSSYRLSGNDDSIRPKPGGIRNVVLDGITAYMSEGGTEYQRNEIVFSGTTSDVLEDVTVRNCRFLLDGGGTAEDAARMDVPEYLDYSMIYADVFSINGILPSAGPFLRHVRNLRLENCEFSLRNADARPVFCAEDVTAVLDGVRISGECGGAMAMNDSEIRTRDSSFNGGEFSADEISGNALELLRKTQKETAETDALFRVWAEEMDRAEKASGGRLVPDLEWRKEGNVWRLAVEGRTANWLIAKLFGNMTLRVNGVEAGSMRIPKIYDNCVWRAFEIGAFLRDGANVLELVWDDPNQRGGVDCLLPFGEFRPYRVGLLQDAILAC